MADDADQIRQGLKDLGTVALGGSLLEPMTNLGGQVYDAYRKGRRWIDDALNPPKPRGDIQLPPDPKRKKKKNRPLGTLYQAPTSAPSSEP